MFALFLEIISFTVMVLQIYSKKHARTLRRLEVQQYSGIM